MLKKLALLLGSIVFALLIAEGGLRLAVDVDASGQAWLRGKSLRPWSFPWHHLDAIVVDSRDSTRARLVFDQRLGWAPAPGFSSTDGRYRYDKDGARRASEAVGAMSREIWFFGDSFVHGDEVPGDSTFTHLLGGNGIRSRGRNFGVSGYGIDQAWLRYELLAAQTAPDVVVLGYQAENAIRNLNCVRPLYQPRTGLPFSKPRFVIDETGMVRRSSFAPVEPGQLRPLIANFLAGSSSIPEGVADPSDYQQSVLWNSRVLSAIAGAIEPRSPQARRIERWLEDPGSDAHRITSELLERFEVAVQARGAEFVVVLMPALPDLRRILDGESARAAGFISQLEHRFTVIDPTQALVESARSDGLADLFVVAHYSPEAHRIIAAELANYFGAVGPN